MRESKDETTHADEFLVLIPDISGPFGTHQNNLIIPLPTFLAKQDYFLYKKYYGNSSGPFSFFSKNVSLTSDIRGTQLPHKNNQILEDAYLINITELIQFIDDHPEAVSCLVKLLISPNIADQKKGKYLFQCLSNEEIQTIKGLSIWPQIENQVLSQLSQNEQEQFTETFQLLTKTFYITADQAGKLYRYVTDPYYRARRRQFDRRGWLAEEDTWNLGMSVNCNCRGTFISTTDVFMAASRMNFMIQEVEERADGGYVVLFHRDFEQYNANRLESFLCYAQKCFHITRSMARAIHQKFNYDFPHRIEEISADDQLIAFEKKLNALNIPFQTIRYHKSDGYSLNLVPDQADITISRILQIQQAESPKVILSYSQAISLLVGAHLLNGSGPLPQISIQNIGEYFSSKGIDDILEIQPLPNGSFEITLPILVDQEVEREDRFRDSLKRFSSEDGLSYQDLSPQMLESIVRSTDDEEKLEFSQDLERRLSDICPYYRLIEHRDGSVTIVTNQRYLSTLEDSVGSHEVNISQARPYFAIYTIDDLDQYSWALAEIIEQLCEGNNSVINTIDHIISYCQMFFPDRFADDSDHVDENLVYQRIIEKWHLLDITQDIVFDLLGAIDNVLDKHSVTESEQNAVLNTNQPAEHMLPALSENNEANNELDVNIEEIVNHDDCKITHCECHFSRKKYGALIFFDVGFLTGILIPVISLTTHQYQWKKMNTNQGGNFNLAIIGIVMGALFLVSVIMTVWYTQGYDQLISQRVLEYSLDGSNAVTKVEKYQSGKIVIMGHNTESVERYIVLTPHASSDLNMGYHFEKGSESGVLEPIPEYGPAYVARLMKAQASSILRTASLDEDADRVDSFLRDLEEDDSPEVTPAPYL